MRHPFFSRSGGWRLCATALHLRRTPDMAAGVWLALAAPLWADSNIIAPSPGYQATDRLTSVSPNGYDVFGNLVAVYADRTPGTLQPEHVAAGRAIWATPTTARRRPPTTPSSSSIPAASRSGSATPSAATSTIESTRSRI